MPKQRNIQRRQSGLVVPSQDAQQSYQQGYQTARQQALYTSKLLAEFDGQYRDAVTQATIDFQLAVSRCLDVWMLAPVFIASELDSRQQRLNAAWDNVHRQLVRYERGLAELDKATGGKGIDSPAPAIMNRLADIGSEVKDALMAFKVDGDTSKLAALDEHYQDTSVANSLQLLATSDIIDTRRHRPGTLYIGQKLDELTTAPGRKLTLWNAAKAIYRDLARMPADKLNEYQQDALTWYHQNGWPDVPASEVRPVQQMLSKYKANWRKVATKP